MMAGLMVAVMVAGMVDQKASLVLMMAGLMAAEWVVESAVDLVARWVAESAVGWVAAMVDAKVAKTADETAATKVA
jgi:hypothetical protein